MFGCLPKRCLVALTRSKRVSFGMRAFNQKLQALLAAACIVAIATSCSHTNGSGDPSLASQNRREYMLMRYADPTTGAVPENVRSMEMAFAATMPGALVNGKSADAVQSGTFVPRGPWNVGGRTRAFALDVMDSQTMIAAGVSGGIWRSTNAGLTWSKTTGPDQIHAVTSIVQDTRPGKQSTWYAATGEIYGNSAQIAGNGIWKSADNARTWQPIASTTSPTDPASGAFSYAWRIVVNPTSDSDEVYVATARSGVQRSADGGQTWRSVVVPGSFFTDVIVTENGVLYAAGSAFTASQQAARAGIWRSTNGITWTDVSPSDLPQTARRIVLASAPSDENQVYALAETPESGTMGQFILRDRTIEEWHSLWKYTYTSGDGAGTGGTWENRSANIPLFGGRSGDFISQGGYDLVVAVSPLDPNVVIVGGTNLYRSTDGFSTDLRSAWIGGYGWPKPGSLFPLYPNHHPDQHGFVFMPTDPTKGYSYNDAGIMRTDNLLADTVQWTSLNNGYLTTQFYAVATPDVANDTRLIGGMQDNGSYMTSTRELTDHWVTRLGGDGSYCVFADSGRTLFASSQQGRVRRILFNNQGEEIGRTRIDPVGATNYLFINPFAVDPNDAELIVQAGGRMLWRNASVSSIPLGRDDSTSVGWDSLSGTRLESGQISSVAIAHLPAHVLYYGTTTGRLFKVTDCTAQTITPVELLHSAIPRGAFTSGIAIDPRDANRVVVSFSNYGLESIISTSDGGTTWSAIGGNLEGSGPTGRGGPAVNDVAIVPQAGGQSRYVAATSIGLYYAVELNGSSTVWNQASATEIGTVPVFMVRARTADDEVIVGTHGRGTFSGTIRSVPDRPQAPQLITPEAEARGIHPDTTLRWQPASSAVSYSIEVATDPAFTQGLRVFGGLVAPEVVVTGLEQGPIAHYWRARAFGPGGSSEPSEIRRFFTAVRPPEPLLPASGAQDVSVEPALFVWERVPDATGYDVEFAPTLAFSTIIGRLSNVVDTTANYTFTEGGRRIFWRVRSMDADTQGIWGSRRSFVAAPTTGVHQNVVVQQLRIEPNPASAIALVSTADERLHYGQYSLYDVEGRSVREGQMAEGMARVNVRGLASGTYNLVLRAGTVRLSTTLVVER